MVPGFRECDTHQLEPECLIQTCPRTSMREPPPAVTETGTSPGGTRRLEQRSLPGLGGYQLRRWRDFPGDDQRRRAGVLLCGGSDGNGALDGRDCGDDITAVAPPPFPARTASTFRMASRIPATSRSSSSAKQNVNGPHVWNAPTQVLQDTTLTVSVDESLVIPVKVPNAVGDVLGKDMPDPTTGLTDGIRTWSVKSKRPTA